MKHTTNHGTAILSSKLSVFDVTPPPKKNVVVYVRVSTNPQDESSQVEMGIQLAYELGYSEDQIILIIDHGVSARKIKMRDREGLVEAMNRALSGDVSMMIVRDRGRIARNMVEYLDIWQRLNTAGVSLVLSDKEDTPVSKNFGDEAMNALLEEIEGDTIANRTKVASRFYPPAPLGYQKLGRKGSTHYEFTADIDVVKDLFQAFSAVTSKDEYVKFRYQWKKQHSRYPDKLLQNLFYAAAIPDGEGVRHARHVIPIVAVTTILENRKKLAQWGYSDENKIRTVQPQKVFIPVICASCGKEMTPWIRKGERLFRCASCRKVIISQDRIHAVMSETTDDLMASLDVSKIQAMVLSQIDLHNKKEKFRRDGLNRRVSKIRGDLLDMLDVKPIDKLIQESKALEGEIQEINRTIDRLESLRCDVDELNDAIRLKIRYSAKQSSEPIQKLLIHHVTVGEETIDVYYRFAELVHEGANYKNE